MKKFYCVFLFLLVSIQIFSQSHVFSEEAEKYWYYRDRLKYFVMPGTAPGQSLLFSARSSAEYNWDRTPYTTQIEQSSMMMGFYIGMLATEYKLLHDNNQLESAQNTLIELNLALDALIRIDNCEDLEPWNFSTEYFDGFFIRSNVTLKSLTKLTRRKLRIVV